MIFFLEMRNRSAPLFLNPMENKKMVSPFFPFFSSSFFLSFYCYFSRPYIVSTPSFQNFKIHPLSVCAFLFAPYCPGWNSGMTTKTKNPTAQGTPDLLSVGGVCPLYPKRTSHHLVLFCPFLLGPLKLGCLVFELKCNYF